MKTPLISVILPVYNSEKYLYQSINSILNQTFLQFELLILNDGSNDSSLEIINSFNDQRIRIFSHKNIGLSATLNKGINLSRSFFIARQDADDISLPQRLDLQFKYMQNHPECNLLGSAAQIIEVDRYVNRYICPPIADIDCKFQLLFKNCFIHSSVMIRKSVLSKVGFYSTKTDRSFAEDYDLWSRISRTSKVSNLGETLVYYRELPDSLSRQNNLKFNSCVINICSQNIALISGRSLNDPIANVLASILYGPPFAFTGLPNFIGIDILIFNLGKLFKSSLNYKLILRELVVMSLIYKLHWLLKCTPIKYIFNPVCQKYKFIFKLWHLAKERYFLKRFS